MNNLTNVESECQDVIVMLRDYMTSKRKIGAREFMSIMGAVLQVMKKLQNKEHGCPTGEHGFESRMCRSIEHKETK